jgi:hypothetical protein
MKKSLLAMVVALAVHDATAEIRVPAFTSYEAPKTAWFGELKNSGKLECAVTANLPAGVKRTLRLTVAGQSHEATATGGGPGPTRFDFGSYDIAAPGYERFDLDTSSEELDALILDGPAAADAHFNLKERRNAASVHLAYPTPGLTNIDAFYCEVTGLEDPTGTYYMACGWNRGYFGMQVNSPTERRIIFSVWDSGNEAVDRGKVGQEDRVTLMGKGKGVYSGDFGNEGTGGHSHFVYDWKTGEKQRFLVTAKIADETHTIFSGYYFRPDENKWMLISSWKAPKDGKLLRGLYSFNEDFDGENGYLRRKALFGNQWIHTADGRWAEITTATFSHDPTGKADRLDRFMGLENGEFFLSNGGFIPGFTRYGEKFVRPAIGQPPVGLPE